MNTPQLAARVRRSCFTLAGSLFGDSRLVGYSLIGIGVIVALIDIIKKINLK
jgi:hypothetical protein